MHQTKSPVQVELGLPQIVRSLVRFGVRFYCAGHLFAMGLFAQSLPSTLNLPNTTDSSGTDTYEATNSVTAANGFIVNNGASVTFKAGSQINLEPGFHATAGTASLTFHAIIGSLTGTVVTTTKLTTATVGLCFSAQLTGAGGVPPYVWTGTGLPSWLTLSSTGLLTGTPSGTSGSPFSFNVTVTDSAHSVSPQQTLTIAVNASGGPIPSREYIRLGTRVIAIENSSCP